ncbi:MULTISPECIES: hypothetical protein [unclassified Pseudomonas]|uniref:hypothetical protein n=1 Tax=Pseudomonas TaxID=286 RepID=UPI00164879B0|nr:MULTISPECIES: hypothetical protein [unclassified Pseudomonas]MBC3422024.1 hypothetical protein [Pseudomonas sp. RW3S2]MBC3467784.1 hypothetical protein [Pseudomonas sp. RW10S2]QXI43262.1 hypothetical protein HU734_000280 [Pseudomonas wayambapalatensis]
MTTDILAPARHVIGSRYVESVNAYVLELTGLATVRVVTGADLRDFKHDQVRIDVDEEGFITGLRNC